MNTSGFNSHDTAYSDHPSAQNDTPGSSGPSNAKYKRNYRACLNCRVRKVKCDLGPVDNPRDGKCARCLRERKDCVFVESKRGGSTNVASGKRKRSRQDLDDESPERDRDESSHASTTSLQSAAPHEMPPKLPSVTSMLQPNGGSTKPNLANFSFPPNTNPQSYSNILPSPQVAPVQGHNPPSSRSGDDKSSSHFSTMEGALVFLAKAAGTIAKADERDHIDARKKHEQIEAGLARERQSSVTTTTTSDATGNTTTTIIRNPTTDSTNGSSASSNPNNLDTILNSNHSSVYGSEVSSTTDFQSQRQQKDPQAVPPYIKSNGGRLTMPAFENASAVRPRASTKLSNIDYIGGPNGILNEQEAETLINYFYSTMYPFFPYLPKFLQSPNVLASYPILLCAILTIASRYHPFENNVGSTGEGGVPRNIEVHDRLWLYVQRLISQTVWAEASTRSLGTVFAFLLFTEWNPRAIHWRWSDYANKAEESSEDAFNYKPDTKDSSGSENLAGLGAMRRSYRMAWMLIGSAVRLAQDMGFMEVSQNTFLATHIAEINSVMNISRRSMLAHSLAEVELDEDEIQEEDLEAYENIDDRILKMNEEEFKRSTSENVLRFTESQKAQIELLQIMSVGHEALYGYKAQLGSLSQRQNLTILNIFSPLINNWGRKYQHLLIKSTNKLPRTTTNFNNIWLNPKSKAAKEISKCMEHESFIFEFNYLKLYIFSLALSPSPPSKSDKKGKRKINLKLDEISRSAKYIEKAFNAANEMLSVAHRVHKLGMLRFMPVRWLTRMVSAVAFIVKCYLTITAHKKSSKNVNTNNSSYDIDSTILSLSLISVDDIIQSIQRAAIILRDSSPDELHLCTRYSNVLMYLCSEMKTNSKNFHDSDVGDSQGSTKSNDPNKPAENQRMSQFPLPIAKMFDIHNNYFEGMSNNSPKPDVDSNSQVNISNPETNQTTNNSSNVNTPLQPVMGDSEVMEWFMNDRNIGLDFVAPWTEMIEQQLNLNDQFSFNEGLDS